MIIEKHTQQSDLTKSKGKTEIVYIIKPEDKAEDLKINNFINSQKIPNTTLEDFQKGESVKWADKMDKEIIGTLPPTPLKDAIKKAAREQAEKEEAEVKKFFNIPEDVFICKCIFCESERGEL